MFSAQRIITQNLATLLLVLLDLANPHHLFAILAGDVKGHDDFLDHSRRFFNPNVFVTHWTIFVQNQPVFNASLAEKLIAIVAFFGITRNL